MTLQRLSALTQAGRSIGDVIAEYRAGKLVLDDEPPCDDPEQALRCDEAVSEFVDRMIAGDLDGAAQFYDGLASSLSSDDLVARVIAPALTETGERWFRHDCTIYQERCVTGFLRRKLDAMIDRAQRMNVRPAHTAVVGTIQGERHEGGLLISALLFEQAGWRVINLGVDLPVAEFSRAVGHLRPDALALSFVLSRNINKRFQELAEIRGVPVFLGGRSILNYQNLARRYGLIPVTGPAATAVAELLREYQAWTQRGSATPAAG